VWLGRLIWIRIRIGIDNWKTVELQ
jgi:hypothetical protein